MRGVVMKSSVRNICMRGFKSSSGLRVSSESLSLFVCLFVCWFAYFSLFLWKWYFLFPAVTRSSPMHIIQNSLANFGEEFNSETNQQRPKMFFKYNELRRLSSQVQHAHPLGASWVLLKISLPQNWVGIYYL